LGHTQLQHLEGGKVREGECPTQTGRGRYPGEMSERGDVRAGEIRRGKYPTFLTGNVIGLQAKLAIERFLQKNFVFRV